MEVPDHNGMGYSRAPQGETYRSRGQLQRHHTIQTCDDAYVSETSPLVYKDHWAHFIKRKQKHARFQRYWSPFSGMTAEGSNQMYCMTEST